MTYFQFLLLFLVLPIVALALILRRRLLNRRLWVLAALLMGIALVYMAPWDHTAAVWHLWTWTPGQNWGIRWWSVPPEEYLFALLESLLAVMLCFALIPRGRRASAKATDEQQRERQEETV